MDVLVCCLVLLGTVEFHEGENEAQSAGTKSGSISCFSVG